jgi:hypothetical protein
MHSLDRHFNFPDDATLPGDHHIAEKHFLVPEVL